jgi:NADH:ubiquinone oxidoreductase subunit 2 (subunit N)
MIVPALLLATIPPLTALAAGLALLAGERRRDPAAPLPGGALALAALAASVAFPGGPERATLVAGLVVALLAHDRRDRLHAECGLKLLWVMGPALALSWLGVTLLAVATGTGATTEQWGVLALGLEPRFLWSLALPLSLIAGLVLLGGAPFHFWLADLMQGGRGWLAPLAAAALQVAGAGWLALRLDGIEGFPAGAEVTGSMLSIAAQVAFVAGAAALPFQRRPERRVGTLASLQGALLLAGLAALHGRVEFESEAAARIAAWSAHLVLALAGAGLLARFLPAPSGPAPAAPLFRRHRLAALAGSYATLSLAGAPGTPGALLWLDVARALASAGHTGILVTLAAAWIAAFATAVQQLRDGFGVPGGAPEAAPGPRGARVALTACALALAGLGVAWMVR